MRRAVSAFLMVFAILAAEWPDWPSGARTVRFPMAFLLLPQRKTRPHQIRSDRTDHLLS
jgi:hypothetical protein